MVIIDFFTGWAAAWINGQLKSRQDYYGVFRKVTVFLMITVAHLIDGILGDAHYFPDAVVFFYLANELLSIIENVGRMGVPMPNILRNAVAIFESKSSGEKKKAADPSGKGNKAL
jgi:toxin secretion/phage lysis holin